jgi:signal transduction histidine kinase
MSSSRQSTNAPSSVRGDANGKSGTASMALIEQAETVKTSLSTALAETKQLVAALKKHRQQSKALQSTLASLRQLQSVDL